mgnify:FL=1
MLDGPEFDTLIHMWEAAITDYVDVRLNNLHLGDIFPCISFSLFLNIVLCICNCSLKKNVLLQWETFSLRIFTL